MELPTCPKCNSLAVGDRCGTCGTEIKRPAPAGAEMQSVSVPGLGLDLDAKPETVAGKTLGRTRDAAVYLQLQQSEQAVLHAASRILAGFAAAGTLSKENEAELSDRAVRLAARMAVVIERYVQSDDEDW
jgi:hypothetical protein